MNNCSTCGERIPQERLDFFLQDGIVCTTCVACSRTEKVFALPMYEHKTAGTVVILPQHNGRTDPETKRQAMRAFNRER